MHLAGFSLARETRDSLRENGRPKKQSCSLQKVPDTTHQQFPHLCDLKMCVLLIFPFWQRQDENQQELCFIFPPPPPNLQLFMEKHLQAIFKVSEQGKQGEIEPTVAKKNAANKPTSTAREPSPCFSLL